MKEQAGLSDKANITITRASGEVIGPKPEEKTATFEDIIGIFTRWMQEAVAWKIRAKRAEQFIEDLGNNQFKVVDCKTYLASRCDHCTIGIIRKAESHIFCDQCGWEGELK